MITEKDKIIISHLRRNARKKVTHISKELKIPATTIYDRISSHEVKGYFTKHVSLLNYQKLGYSINALLVMRGTRLNRSILETYLSSHPNVNSLYRTDASHDFIAEVVFENSSKLREFLDAVEAKFDIEQPHMFNIVQEIKKEGFLS